MTIRAAYRTGHEGTTSDFVNSDFMSRTLSSRTKLPTIICSETSSTKNTYGALLNNTQSLTGKKNKTLTGPANHCKSMYRANTH